jgi:hypothetical protein
MAANQLSWRRVPILAAMIDQRRGAAPAFEHDTCVACLKSLAKKL